MDENELANILQEPKQIWVTHETEYKHEIIFKEASNNADEELFEDSDKYYETEYEK